MTNKIQKSYNISKGSVFRELSRNPTIPKLGVGDKFLALKNALDISYKDNSIALFLAQENLYESGMNVGNNYCEGRLSLS